MPGRKGIEDARREAREMRQRLEAEVQARRLAEAEQVSLRASLNSERAKLEETMRKRIDQETQALSRIDKERIAAKQEIATLKERLNVMGERVSTEVCQ
jgi:chromosome segregation ATPase